MSIIPSWKVVIRDSFGHCVQIHECVCLTASEAVQSAKDVYPHLIKGNSFKATETFK